MKKNSKMTMKQWKLCKLYFLVFLMVFVFCLISVIFSSSSSPTSSSSKFFPLKKDAIKMEDDDGIYHFKKIVNDDEYHQCILETPDPWDPTIPRKFLNANLSTCFSQYRTLTSLEDGYVKVDLTLAKPNTTCQWQCLIPDDNEVTYTKSEWHDIKERSICDVVKSRCFTNGNAEEQYYENLHCQIIPKETSQSEKLQASKSPTPLYNVHILVLDAVSRSQGIRFIPNTIRYVEEKMDAIHFPFFNKVAWNSWPNGEAFLLGHSPTRDFIPPSIMRELCDNQTFSKHYFGNILQDMGYITLFNEDVYSIFEHINVTATHKLAPLGAELKKTAKYKETLFYGDHCISGLDYNIEMFQKFIDAYPTNKPKFSLNWNSQTSHDQFNWLYVADDILLKFLEKNQEELDNSYFILMGDHGPNVGEHRYHETVALEERNPMLYFSLPKALRNPKSPLVRQLKQNTDKLISHYDLYATFIDIVESLGADIPLDITFHGKSLFTPIPGGRDCRALGISPMYCNCRSQRVPLTSDDPLYQKIIDAIFTHVNKTIAPYTDVCKFPTYSPKFPPIMQQIVSYPGTSDNLKIYRVILETQPDDARWETNVYVKFYHNSTVEIGNMLNLGNRLNPFGLRCSDKIRDFCFCKDS